MPLRWKMSLISAVAIIATLVFVLIPVYVAGRKQLADLHGLRLTAIASSASVVMLPDSLDVVAANFGGLTEVRFDGYGTPSNGGTIVLQARNYQCTVTLDGTTGQATITSNHPGGRTAKVL